jgi:dihydrofolate reductase
VRKLIVVEYVSLDGVVQAPGHAAEDVAGGVRPWRLDRPPHGRPRALQQRAVPDGRRVPAWPSDLRNLRRVWPSLTDERNQVAHALNTLPKYVASTTLRQERAGWAGTTILNGDLATEVARLKEQPGRPILVVGSARLAQALQRHDLVDEYRLWLHPVVLGGGKRLFADGVAPATFRLVDGMTTSGGLALLTYERAAA